MVRWRKGPWAKMVEVVPCGLSGANLSHGSMLVSCQFGPRTNPSFPPNLNQNAVISMQKITIYRESIVCAFSRLRWRIQLKPFSSHKGPVYPASSIPWMLMIWRRKGPGHHQPWYSTISWGILPYQHQKYWNLGSWLLADKTNIR